MKIISQIAIYYPTNIILNKRKPKNKQVLIPLDGTSTNTNMINRQLQHRTNDNQRSTYENKN
jgi:hypothetical protein